MDFQRTICFIWLINDQFFSSPGFGLFLTAETTEGIVYHGEAVSKPKGEQGDPVVPEDVGHSAACQLLDQIFAVNAFFTDRLY